MHWSKLDPWSETRNQIDALLMTDNIAKLSDVLGAQIKFAKKPAGEVVAKKGAGWAKFNFLTA